MINEKGFPSSKLFLTDVCVFRWACPVEPFSRARCTGRKDSTVHDNVDRIPVCILHHTSIHIPTSFVESQEIGAESPRVGVRDVIYSKKRQ